MDPDPIAKPSPLLGNTPPKQDLDGASLHQDPGSSTRKNRHITGQTHVKAAWTSGNKLREILGAGSQSERSSAPVSKLKLPEHVPAASALLCAMHTIIPIFVGLSSSSLEQLLIVLLDLREVKAFISGNAKSRSAATRTASGTTCTSCLCLDPGHSNASLAHSIAGAQKHQLAAC